MSELRCEKLNSESEESVTGRDDLSGIGSGAEREREQEGISVPGQFLRCKHIVTEDYSTAILRVFLLSASLRVSLPMTQ